MAGRKLNYTPFGIGAYIYNSVTAERGLVPRIGVVTGLAYTDCEKLDMPHVAQLKVEWVDTGSAGYIPLCYAAAAIATYGVPPEVR